MGLSFVWTGAGGTAFSDATNWDDVTDNLNPASVAPGTADIADITNPASLTGPGVAFDLIVGAVASLAGTITLGDSLSVGSQLTLGAGAVLTAPVIGVTAAGSVEVQAGATLAVPGTLVGTLDAFPDSGQFSGSLTVDGGVFDAGGLVSFGVASGDVPGILVDAGGTLDAWSMALADAAGVQAGLTLAGSGTVVNLLGAPVVGSTASGGTLIVGGGGTLGIAGGALLAVGAAQLGASLGGAGAVVSGGGTWDVAGGGLIIGGIAGQTGSLDVGSAGLVAVATSLAVRNGLATIEAGGSVSVSGSGVTVGSAGTLQVAGAAAVLSAGSGDLAVGGAVTISNGGSVTALGLALTGGALLVQSGGTLATGSDGGVLGGTAAAAGAASLDGTGSVWQDLGPLDVGSAGSGTLALTDGAMASATTVSIGQAGGSGLVTLDGGALLQDAGALAVGNAGTGTLAMTAGAGATASSVSIGEAGGSGTVSVDGHAATLGDSGALGIGVGGTGALTLALSGMASATDLTVGAGLGGAGNLLIGALSTLDTTGTDGAVIGADASAEGTVTLDGGNSRWNLTGPLTIGALGKGTLTVSNGGFVDAGAGAVTLGNSAGGSGIVRVSNGTLDTGAGALLVGGQGTGTLDLASSATVETGGSLSVALAAGARGTIDIDGFGSTLSVAGGATLGAGAAVAATNDGSLQVSGNLTLSAGATLSVDHTGSIEIGTVNDPLSGGIAIDSGATLSGAGLVSGALALNGVIAATGGTLELTGTVGDPGVLRIAAGATLKLDSSDARAAIVFANPTGGTLLASIGKLSGATIDGFAPGDTVLLSDAIGATASLGVGNGFTTLELFAAGSLLGSLDFAGTPDLRFNASNGAVTDASHTFVWIGASGVSGLLSSPSSWDDVSSGTLFAAATAPGPDATVEIGSGAVLAGSASVGVVALAGTATLGGIGSDLVSARGLALGDTANSTLDVTAGASFAIAATAAAGADNVAIGVAAGKAGAVTIEGTAALLAVGAGALAVGLAGSGLLAVRQGGAVTASAASATTLAPAVAIGVSAGAAGNATIDGAGSTLAALGALWVGQAGSGTLVVSGGARVSAGGSNDGGTGLWIGQSGGPGRVLATAGTLAVADGARIGAAGTLAALAGGSLLIAGNLTLDPGATLSVDPLSGAEVGGGAIVAGALDIAAGSSAAGAGRIAGNVLANGTLLATGGSLEITGSVFGAGTLAIAGSGALTLDAADLGAAVAFLTPGGTLSLPTASIGGALVQNFLPGDEVVVGNAIGASATASHDGGITTLSLSTGGSITFAGNLDLNFNAGNGAVTTSLGNRTTLFDFNASTGRFPEAGLIGDSAGDLFGTTFFGGASNQGAVFELLNNGHASYSYTTLLSFDGSNGTNPAAGLLDLGGSLFGTTSGQLGLGDGTVFELAKSGSGYVASTLVTFTGSNGASPSAGLIADTAGDLFGTTSSGGANGDGTVFELVKGAGGYTLTTLVSFAGGNGANPNAALLEDAAGNLYGTTTAGGTNGDGTVFEIARSAGGFAHAPVTLLDFDGADGSGPLAGLVTDSAGDFFGTTSGGGASNHGAVFELSPSGSGAFKSATLASFNGTDGSDPAAGLIIDSAGNLFGTTGTGGVNDDGTAFEVANTATGYASTPTTLVSFNGSDGANPFGGLSADASGNLYGTTGNSGAHGVGTVFELTGAGYQAAQSAACYRAGTRIATRCGARAIETLSVGDRVLTASGEARPILWLGHRRVDCRRHPRPGDVWPVRVRAGAFGAGRPHADLFLSPDHAVFVDGVLIPVRYLRNGDTIRQERADSVVYWHLELDRHDVVLAEGLPAESFLDTGQRGAFANGGGVVALHPDFAQRLWDADGCAPLVVAGPRLERVRAALRRRRRAGQPRPLAAGA